MNRMNLSLKFMLLTSRLDQMWLPAAFCALFLIIARMTQDSSTGYPVAVAFLGVALPLIGGILAAYAVLDDPVLELQFATPRPAWSMLLERLATILVLLGICAAAYQAVLAAFGFDLRPLGGIFTRQMAWFIPTLAMMALSSAASFASRQAMTGAALTGMVWIIQLLLRSWFLESWLGRYVLLMMGSNYPDNPALRANQATLAGLSALLLVAAWALLRRQERYI